MVKLREYQLQTIKETKKIIEQGCKEMIWVLPCGAGKTTVAAAYIDSLVQNGKRVLIFVHRKNLVAQFAERLKNQFRIKSGIIMGSHRTNYELPVQVASVDTLKNRDKPSADYIFVDETHIGLRRTQAVLLSYPNAVIIGLTATPFRGDGKGLGDIYKKIIHPITVRELINQKSLVPTKPIMIKELDMSGVEITRGADGSMEYNQAQMLQLFNDPNLLSAFIEKYKEVLEGQPMLTFCINVKHAKMMTRYTNKQSVPSAYIVGDMKDEERLKIMNDFERGKIKILHSVGLFREGLDATFIKGVALLKAFFSLGDYVQSTSRGTRPCLNKNYEWLKNEDGSFYKESCIVLDAGNNTTRHGLVEDYDGIPFNLDGIEKPKGEPLLKCCPDCFSYTHISAKVCPNCDYEYPFKPKEIEIIQIGNIVFEGIDTERLIVERLQKIRHHEIEQKIPISQLRIYAELRGYKDAWWFYKAISLKYVNVNKEAKGAFCTVKKLLELAEYKGQTHDLLKKIKKAKKT